MGTTQPTLRGALLVVCALAAVAFAPNAAAYELRLDERIAAQEAIEQVHWAHRVWPEGNPQPKPELRAVLSEAAVRSKVERALRMSARLEAARNQPLTGAELQAEIARIVAGTKAPDTLREVFAALGYDPRLIAECVARPALVARLAAAYDLHDDGRAPEGVDFDRLAVEAPAEGYVVPAVPGGGCTNDSWGQSSLATGTGARLPTARELHTAVWTGSEMIVWGGWNGTSTAYNDGGVYDPVTDAWVLSQLTNGTGTNVPSARLRHTAVWTGTEMIVWGGRTAGGAALNTGGRYNPTADAWAVSTLENGTGVAVPSARQLHTAVWTGTYMVVWGGSPDTPANAVSTGALYDPSTDGWTQLGIGSSALTPAARTDHTAVWTGTEMLVWGGRGTAGDLDTGGIYNPATDSWASTVLNTGGGTLIPQARHYHTAVWTGSEMIIWGGTNGTASLNTGGIYNRTADGWVSSSLKNASGVRVPTARQLHTAIWTGGEMIVWGGSTDGSQAVLNTGGRYSPVTDGWAVSSLTNATGVRVPSGRQYHTAVWTGSEMIIWGGSSGTPTGGLFCATCPIVSYHADADGDGFGDPAVAQASCAQPAGFVPSADDCDDTNAAVHPGATELCDGIDNDCDTIVDNGGGALCTDGDACTADVCNGAGGCAAPSATANLDVTGFSASRVDGRDLVIFADAWMSCPGDLRYNAAANLDQGGPPNDCIDLSDFHLFMNSFGQTCP